MGNLDNCDALHTVYLIMKVFYRCNHVTMCEHIMKEDVFGQWMKYFKTVLDMPIPDDLVTNTEDTAEILKQNKTIFWKTKGMAAKITHCVFLKYSDPKRKVTEPHEKSFAKTFQVTYALPWVESHLHLFLSRKQHLIGLKCLNFVIKVLIQSCHMDYTMEKLQPYSHMLYDTIIRIMLIADKDIQMFESDPVEYIR